MFGFRRKPKTDDLEEEASGKDTDKPKRRRRKKEEPPKPWGKRERFLVLAILVATALTPAALALNAREWKLPGLPRIGLPKGVFEQTLVFEGKPLSRDTSVVTREFRNLTKNASGIYGLYVVSLNTGESYGVNEDDLFQAASLIKLPAMAAMYSEHENDRINLDNVYTLRAEDKVGGAGSLYYQEPGSQYYYRELVEAMGQTSDNTAFRASINLLGQSFLDEYISSIGMVNTSISENLTTPREIGIFFKKLWEKRLVESANRDEILKSLTNTAYETMIPAGISGVRIAHKYGREVHVINDAGIVFADNPYVLVIMSKGIVESEAVKLIPELAALVHRFEVGDI